MKPTFLALLFVIPAPGVFGSNPPPDGIDLAPVIRIGDYTVSRYLFEKAREPFVAAVSRTTGRPPDAEANAQWFRLYLAQQLIKADLAGRGWLDRAEVREMTERMARHMMIQPRGVLYRELGGADPLASHRERRARILQESEFSPIAENIARLWTSLAPGLSRGVLPAESDVAGIAGLLLAEYSFAGQPRRITAVDFVRDFRQGVARMSPRGASGLREQVEDMAVAEHDLAEAKRRGLDRTPQFLEDRRNFALNQALALYEQEVLAARAPVTDKEVLAHYEAHAGRYASPAEIRGILFLHADVEEARRALVADGTGVPAGPGEPIVLRRDDPTLFGDLPFSFLASAPAGRRYGPFSYAGRQAVFLKQATGEPRPRPLGEVIPEIRRRLLREKLDALELSELDRSAGRLQLRFDPSHYGIFVPELATLPAGALSSTDQSPR